MKCEGQAPSAASAWLDGVGVAIRDAIVITFCASGVGMLANLVHPERIPLLAERHYETLVPCPEPGGEVAPLEARDFSLTRAQTFFIDARSDNEHAAWKFGDAMNVPYDYLDPTPDDVIEDLARRIARSRARRVVVYGDGATPDSGEQLGKEISAKGIKNVFFIRGGGPALRKSTEQEVGP